MHETYIELFAKTLSKEEHVALTLRYGGEIREWSFQMSSRELTRIILRGQAQQGVQKRIADCLLEQIDELLEKEDGKEDATI